MNEQEQPIQSAEDAHNQLSHQILTRATMGVKLIMAYAYARHPDYMKPLHAEVDAADAFDPEAYQKTDAHRLTVCIFNEIQRAIIESHLDNKEFPPQDLLFETARNRLEEVKLGLAEMENPDKLHDHLLRRITAVMLTGTLQTKWETESFNWKTIAENLHDQRRLKWLFARELHRLRERDLDPEDFTMQEVADNIRHAFEAGEEVTSVEERNTYADFYPHHNFPEKPAFLQEI